MTNRRPRKPYEPPRVCRHCHANVPAKIIDRHEHRHEQTDELFWAVVRQTGFNPLAKTIAL